MHHRYWLGKKRPKATILKMSLSQKGKKRPQKIVDAVPEIKKGIFCSECEREVLFRGYNVVKNRPIRLAEIVIAIGKKNEEIFVKEVWEDSVTGSLKTLLSLYNLTKDNLDDQSPECIAFLEKILL